MQLEWILTDRLGALSQQFRYFSIRGKVSAFFWGTKNLGFSDRWMILERHSQPPTLDDILKYNKKRWILYN